MPYRRVAVIVASSRKMSLACCRTSGWPKSLLDVDVFSIRCHVAAVSITPH